MIPSEHAATHATNQPVFRALADTTRRDILLMLSQQDMTIHEVAAQFSMTRAAVKKHLKILEEAALISVQTKGRERINSLEPQGLQSASEWINYFSHFWNERLGHLQTGVEREESQKKSNDSLNGS